MSPRFVSSSIAIRTTRFTRFTIFLLFGCGVFVAMEGEAVLVLVFIKGLLSVEMAVELVVVGGGTGLLMEIAAELAVAEGVLSMEMTAELVVVLVVIERVVSVEMAAALLLRPVVVQDALVLLLTMSLRADVHVIVLTKKLFNTQKKLGGR